MRQNMVFFNKSSRERDTPSPRSNPQRRRHLDPPILKFWVRHCESVTTHDTMVEPRADPHV